MQLNLRELQKAFSMAYSLSQSDRVDSTSRAYFRAIAYQIWRSANSNAVGSYDPKAASERLVNSNEQ